MAKLTHRVYIAQEGSLPGLPGSKELSKIGLAQETSEEKDSGTFILRERQFNQGNPRSMEVQKFWVDTERNARNFERQLHKRIKKTHVCLYDVTGKTGHGEWFFITVEEATAIGDELFERNSRQKESRNNNFANFFKED